jgi:hypothetical protein
MTRTRTIKVVRFVLWAWAAFAVIGTLAVIILRWNAILVVSRDTKQRLLDMSALSIATWCLLGGGLLCLLYLMKSDGIFAGIGEIIGALQDAKRSPPAASGAAQSRYARSKIEELRSAVKAMEKLCLSPSVLSDPRNGPIIDNFRNISRDFASETNFVGDLQTIQGGVLRILGINDYASRAHPTENRDFAAEMQLKRDVMAAVERILDGTNWVVRE